MKALAADVDAIARREVYGPRPLGRGHPRSTEGRTQRLLPYLRLPRAADADLVVLGDDASVRHVMAPGRWHVSDGEIMIKPTIQETRG